MFDVCDTIAVSGIWGHNVGTVSQARCSLGLPASAPMLLRNVSARTGGPGRLLGTPAQQLSKCHLKVVSNGLVVHNRRTHQGCAQT